MEHILVCLSSSPSNAGIIKAGAEMAEAFGADLLAVYIETDSENSKGAAEAVGLEENISYAKRLGARTEKIYAPDVVTGLAQYARVNGVSRIVIGQTVSRRFHIVVKSDLSQRLIEAVPEIAVFIIPDKTGKSRFRMQKQVSRPRRTRRDLLITVAFLGAATMAGSFFRRAGLLESNIITFYILAVLLISVTTSRWLWGLIASAAVVIIFNFFFTEPIYSFHAYDWRYAVTFAVMFISAIISGLLASRLKDYAQQYAIRAYRNKLLFETNQLLQQTTGEREILSVCARQLAKLLGNGVLLYFPAEEKVLDGPYRVTTLNDEPELAEDPLAISERPAAKWTLEHRERSGFDTPHYGECTHMYLAARTAGNVYGVIGLEGVSPDMDEPVFTTCLSIIGECSLAAENDRNAREKEQARAKAKAEQLRADLLRTISHDLRTPLTSISGNASTLMQSGQILDEGTRSRIYTDIYDDSMWLITVVENLLSVTRLENGQMQLHTQDELVSDVVDEAMRHIDRQKDLHEIVVEHSEDFLLAHMDSKLIMQVIINLVNNAIKYTQEGSKIQVRESFEDGMVQVTVSDNGPGLTDEMKEHAFDMFYIGGNKVADGRRSLGLGLALCRSIMEAHGGSINVQDNEPQGAVFSFTLPGKEVTANE